MKSGGTLPLAKEHQSPAAVGRQKHGLFLYGFQREHSLLTT